MSLSAELLVSVPLNTGISPGESVTIPISLSGTAVGSNIGGYSLRIVYPAFLSEPAVIRTGTLSESVPDENFSFKEKPLDGTGMYSIGAYGVSFDQDGILVNIRFHVSPDASPSEANILFVSPNNKTAIFTNGYESVPAQFIPLQGDINGDGNTDLADSIAGLQILSGLSPAHVQLLADIDNDRSIGMAEVLFIMEYLTEY